MKKYWCVYFLKNREDGVRKLYILYTYEHVVNYDWPLIHVHGDYYCLAFTGNSVNVNLLVLVEVWQTVAYRCASSCVWPDDLLGWMAPHTPDTHDLWPPCGSWHERPSCLMCETPSHIDCTWKVYLLCVFLCAWTDQMRLGNPCHSMSTWTATLLCHSNNENI